MVSDSFVYGVAVSIVLFDCYPVPVALYGVILQSVQHQDWMETTPGQHLPCAAFITIDGINIDKTPNLVEETFKPFSNDTWF